MRLTAFLPPSCSWPAGSVGSSVAISPARRRQADDLQIGLRIIPGRTITTVIIDKPAVTAGSRMRPDCLPTQGPASM